MMKTNPLYDQRLEKVKKCIKFENDHVLSTYMGQAVAPTYTDITMAEYMSDSRKGLQFFIEFVNKLNSLAPIDCINFAYPGAHQAALTLIWWSQVKMPGEELDENAIWQVEERKLLQDDDYKLIIEKGSSAVSSRILPQIIDMKKIDNFFKFYVDDYPDVMQQYIDNSYPILNSGIACPPFETLCGARSMSAFFMDCYKKMDLIEEAQNVMLEETIAQLKAMPSADYLIGRWVGGWRGASALVSPKIWDRLVWPYMYKIAMVLIEKGIVPIFHLDQNWNRDLERFKELPAKSCIMNTDGMTDLRLAKKSLEITWHLWEMFLHKC